MCLICEMFLECAENLQSDIIKSLLLIEDTSGSIR